MCSYNTIMYPRRVTVRGKTRTYRYVQLVNSYRRGDGVSTNRIVANLGELTDREYENLKLAFKASRAGTAVIISDKATASFKKAKVKSNLRYLDITVMREIWREWDLSFLLSELIGYEETTISTCDVIEILTHQRCVAPRSKLYAQEWFPTTALPELMGIPIQHFNNTRVHRALDVLYDCTPKLQERLPARYLDHQPAFIAMYLDVTDTWFEGHGCESAERQRTKAGHRNKKCIGIVLLANEKGYPLRWAVVPGKSKDHVVMAEMIERVKELRWAQNVPLVCDRAMGQQTSLEKLSATGLHFLTAAHVDSIEFYTTKVPWELFSEIEIEATERSCKADIEKIVKAADKAEDLEKVDEDLFVMDLGVITCSPDKEPPNDGRRRGRRAAGIRERLEYARQLQERIDSCELENIEELARELDLTPLRVSQRLSPLRLTRAMQQFIQPLASDVPITEAQLRKLLKVKGARAQRRLLEELIAPKASSKKAEEGSEISPQEAEVNRPYKLRVMAYFNPQMFVDQRRRASEHREELGKFVVELNKDLANAKRTRKEEPTRRKLVQRLEKNNWLDLFDIELKPISLKKGKITSFDCALKLRADAWKRRHRYNGFVLLLAHPELEKTPRELALLYRAKDMVEKDFQCIKSVIKLRPIYHNTDKKVEAHISLCMMSLLLERSLEEKLADGGLKQTAALTIDRLATCHLNLLKPGQGGGSFYSITEPTRNQTKVLKALNLLHLVDDKEVAGQITRRL